MTARPRGVTPARRRTAAVAALAALVAALAVAGGQWRTARALAPALTFGTTHDLGASGGEPSIQDDGRGHLYITTPTGTGSLNGVGVLLQRSLDGGTSFQPNQLVGGPIGGSDSDVTTDVTGKNVYIADLAAAFTNVLRSTDVGATFPQTTQVGPDDDREWLTPIGPTLFLTYHDLANNVPLIFISTDQGQTWSQGGTAGMIVGPSDTGFADTHCNTLVSKPVTDSSGNLYVLTNTSTLAEDFVNGQCASAAPLDRFYLSVSKDGGHTFTTHLVNDISAGATGKATSGSWGHVFNQLGIDAAGNLYIDTSGSLDGAAPNQNYLLVSTDHGTTFGKPIPTHASANAQVFPAIAVGQAGQVAVGYYEGTKPDNNAAQNNFQFFIDETLNALDPSPAFTHTQLPALKGSTPHPDGICTVGIFCLPGGSSNRNLADFESMTVDQNGNLEVIIPADCDACKGVTENWFYKQTAGPALVPGPTNGNGTGNQTWVAGSRTAPPPTPTPAPAAAATAAPAPALPNTAGAAPGSTVAAVALLGSGAVALAAAGRRRRRRL